MPQGGNTGLVVGSIPDDSGTQVVLSLQRMQAIRNSPIFTVGLERLPKGKGYRFHIVPMSQALPESPELAAAQINAALEQMVRKMPMQYLWGYNRYKTPRPDRAS